MNNRHKPAGILQTLTGIIFYLISGAVVTVSAYYMQNGGRDMDYLLYSLLWILVVFILSGMILCIPLLIRALLYGKKTSIALPVMAFSVTAISFLYFLLKVIKLEIYVTVIIVAGSLLLSAVYSLLIYHAVKKGIKTGGGPPKTVSINPVELKAVRTRQDLAGIDPDKMPLYSEEMKNLSVEEWRLLKTKLKLAGYDIEKE